MADPWTLHWLEAARAFPLHLRNRIIADLHAAETTLEAQLPLPVLDIVIAPRPARWCIPEYGLGGFATHETAFSIVFDLESKTLPDALKRGALQRIVLHEINHCLRMASPEAGTTLGDALVSEGLAGHFVRLLTGCAPEPWEDAVSTQEMLDHLPTSRELEAIGYDHAEWFFGHAERPRWLGYTLGYRMVRAYCAAHHITAPADLISTPSQEVLRHLDHQGM